MNFVRISDWQPSQTAVFFKGLALVLILGALDFATGYEVSMFIFYGIPIVMVAWFADKKQAILLALLAGLTWWWADRLALHPYQWGWIEAWETAVRLTFFVFAAVSGASIRANHDAVKNRIQLLEHSTKLEQEIVTISEQEQRRIGQDLHDGLCQYLAALGYSAASLRADLQAAGCTTLALSAQDLAERLKESVTQTRDLARGLVPVQMDEAGLVSALEELTTSASRLLNIDCVLHCENGTLVADYAAATNLYRIAQEAINNAVKHGKANRVDLYLNSTTSTRDIDLIVEDNGVGIASDACHSTGLGLKIMRYRSRSIGGELHVGPRPAGGTAIHCAIRQETCSNNANGSLS